MAQNTTYSKLHILLVYLQTEVFLDAGKLPYAEPNL